MTIEKLARREILELQPYETAKQVAGLVRLNANEAPWPIDGGSRDGLNRYPQIRPLDLHARLAAHYGVSPDMILATRGSSEAIDLLIRAFCRAGVDNIMVSPPTFAMYRVYADIQGAQTISAPLQADNDFALDAAAVLEGCTAETKLVFVCSPNNPTGGLVPLPAVQELCLGRADRSLIIVDEAYAEFSDAPSATSLFDDDSRRYANLVVLRTLSKGYSLAGARCGAVIAIPAAIRLLSRILAPYALATPVVDCVLRALEPEGIERARRAAGKVLRERERLAVALRQCPDVVNVWPSRSNFLLVKFRSLPEAEERLRAHRILVREFADDAALRNCARISVGTPQENDLLLEALGACAERRLT
ncbi:MAG TPA: histidinol-phosphate transaminase [Mycobacterium sp.]|nr:histidinol-phosphate transaminase [Mycobacterium sp.]